MSSSTLTRFSQAGTTTSMKAFYSSIMVGSPFVSQDRESEVNRATRRHPAFPDHRWAVTPRACPVRLLRLSLFSGSRSDPPVAGHKTAPVVLPTPPGLPEHNVLDLSGSGGYLNHPRMSVTIFTAPPTTAIHLRTWSAGCFLS